MVRREGATRGSPEAAVSRRVRIHPEAAAEAEAAVAWCEDEHTGLGSSLASDLEFANARLSNPIEKGVPVLSGAAPTGSRRIVLRRFPYDVVFILEGDVATILAYAHHARRPGYWRKRQSKPTRSGR
mgnify:CR=1 FL=1